MKLIGGTEVRQAMQTMRLNAEHQQWVRAHFKRNSLRAVGGSRCGQQSSRRQLTGIEIIQSGGGPDAA